MADKFNEDLKKIGKEMESAFSDLGKTLVKGIKIVAKKVDDWANEEEKPEDDKK